MNEAVYRISDSTSLFYATSRIVARDEAGRESVGSGFFLSYPAGDGKTLQALVTNKHVVAGAVEYDLHFHEACDDGNGELRPSGAVHGFRLRMLDKGWFDHPSEDVDLCATPLEPFRKEAERLGKRIFLTTLSTDHIPDQEAISRLLALEEVTMIGYPIGLWDQVNNFPLARRGMTASHPNVDFDGRPIGVVDIGAFPGSSGSPVLIVNEGGYGVADGFVAGGRRVLLLGVLFAGPQFRADGSVDVSEIPTTRSAQFTINLPLHLGFYVKARELLPLGEVLFAATNRVP